MSGTRSKRYGKSSNVTLNIKLTVNDRTQAMLEKFEDSARKSVHLMLLV